MGFTEDDLDNLFTYHPPKDEETKERYAKINEAAKNLARVILQNTPGSAMQTHAINSSILSKMWANASIATHGG